MYTAVWHSMIIFEIISFGFLSVFLFIFCYYYFLKFFKKLERFYLDCKMDEVQFFNPKE